MGTSRKTALADLRVMGSEEPASEGSVSSFDFRILITWMRKEMLRVMTTTTGTARNRIDDLNISSSCPLLPFLYYLPLILFNSS